MAKRNLDPVTVLATWFGCGLSPFAPGTIGTLGAIPVVGLVLQWGPLPYMVATLVFTLFAIFVAHLYEIGTGQHDLREVVIDEVAGFMVTMTWVPFSVTYVVLGFLLFRLFDVWKPFPISYLDRKIGGGVGVVADDLVAGIFANILLQVVLQKNVLPW